MAALALALVQAGRTDAALLDAQLLVQLHEVRRDGARDELALLLHGRLLGGDPALGGVAAHGRVLGLGLDGGDPLVQLGEALLDGLAALHDLEDDLLQVALALGEGDELALEVLQVLRGGGTGVEALLVARGPLADLVDVLLGLGLLTAAVALLGLRGDEQVAQLGEVLGQRLDLGVLGQRAALVRELLEADVEGLDVEEADLVGGRGVQLGAPGEVWWEDQGSVTVFETWTRRSQP
ncbi:hypothetical protein GCM10018791_70960 [Streptomyces zaomyceticus]|nr:hypothetical protein GCM10018791_70960 [Streptomyces zaomyceticus]